MDIFAVNGAKLLSAFTKKFNLGNGSTWPGHLLLKREPHFLKKVFRENTIPVIVIAGTNGKTTTARMLKHILVTSGKKVIHNESGANLLSGIVSSVILKMTKSGNLQADYALFEVDENALPRLLREITPSIILVLNIFRDQLDRYGEVDSVAREWQEAFKKLPKTTQIILNADDPLVAHLGNGLQAGVSYFGVSAKKTNTPLQHAADSIYCPRCGHKLSYAGVSFSHLGLWQCPACHLKRPTPGATSAPYYPLSGTYNEYNTIAASEIARRLHITDGEIRKSLKKFSPAFGRQEEITYKHRRAVLFLSKNPTGFNESLRTVTELHGKSVLLALNDRYADGTDVSWIWDVDFEDFISSFRHITVTGERAYDLGLRLLYADYQKSQTTIETDLHRALDSAIEQTPKNETLYILPTYTAMLAIRKILTGKKIL